MKKTVSKVLLPEKLIISLQKEILPKISGFNIDRMYYIVSQIVIHRQEPHSGSYSKLNMVFLNNIVPRSNLYLNWLRDLNYIEWKNYSAGRNSRLYRIKKDYEGPVVWRTINDQYLIRRIEHKYKHLKKLNSNKYPALNSYIRRVRINVDEAIETAELTYKKGLLMNRKEAEGRYAFSLAEIHKIRSGEIYIKCSKTNGRLDTNFTRLPSELVQHLTIDETQLFEIDIVNSQPFFASCLFDPTSDLKEIIGKSLYMLTKRLQLTDKHDVKRYCSLVSTGNFYNYLNDQFQANGISFENRDKLKEALFIVFFGKNNARYYSRPVKVFVTLFPNVYALFEEIKKHHHNRLAIMLQQIESFIVLDNVVPEIISKYPDLPFITKHDSILPSRNLSNDKIKSLIGLIKERINIITGMSPSIKIKLNDQII